MLGIVDAVIIVLLLFGGVCGFKSGFIKQTVFLIGTILTFIIAYYLKDYLANFLSYNLPFFKFGGAIEGLTSLNIVLYQMIAFLTIQALLGLILGIILKVANFFENVLKATVILSIPSKILGFILGVVEAYVMIFITLFFLSQPAFNITIVKESKLTPIIVNSSPGLSNIVKDTTKSADEIYSLIKTYNNDKDKDKFNRDSIDIMLKNKLIEPSYVDKLIDKGKINIDGIEIILDKYR